MASSLLRYACYACKNIPTGNAFVCDNLHLYCENCAAEANKICRCKKDLVSKQNPLLSALEKNGSNCKYKANGCKWMLKHDSNHESECKFRPEKCIGARLNVFSCSWNGILDTSFQHMTNMHRKQMEFYNHADEGTFFFDEQNPKPRIGCIDAHSNKFILYYIPTKETRTINIVVLLCGTKLSARKYIYEFEIVSKKNPNLKIKFNQECKSDSDDIVEIIASGNCAAIGFHVIKNYLSGNKIHFRFRILRLKT